MKFKNFDIEDVFGFDDAEQAKAYIGKKGYYADHIEKLDDYIENKSHIDTLYTINKSRDIYRFMVGCSYDYCGYYTYFLPLEKVKKTELTETKVTYRYRPFKTMQELTEVVRGKDWEMNDITTGDELMIRSKGCEDRHRRVLITDLTLDNNCNLLFINNETMKVWLDNYEVMSSSACDWVPFGVEIEDED